MSRNLPVCLSIAGSDPSGGAGIDADLKTLLANGVYGCAVITAITAQNTKTVSAVNPVSAELLQAQLDSVFSDITPSAVKIGMTGNAKLVHVIARCLKDWHAENVVCDPVLISSSGTRLTEEAAQDAMQEKLFPLCRLITPNIPEAETLSGVRILSDDDRILAAKSLSEKTGSAVLVKGGHAAGLARDLLYEAGTCTWFEAERIDNKNTHGTGCTLSSAIAANLAKYKDLKTAVQRAKEYLTGAIRAGLDLGKGSGPLDHGYALSGEFTE